MTPLEAATKLQDIITLYAVTPLLILFIGIFIAKILEQTLLFLFHEFKKTSHPYTYGAYMAKWAVYIATFSAALASVGILDIALYFIAGVIAALLIVRILLGTIDFVPNYFAYHAVKQKYKEGSKLKTKLVDGTVVKVQLADTHVRTNTGDEVFIPNSTLRNMKKN